MNAKNNFWNDAFLEMCIQTVIKSFLAHIQGYCFPQVDYACKFMNKTIWTALTSNMDNSLDEKYFRRK